MSPRRRTPPLVAAVKRDLAALSRRSPGAERSAEALLALRLAAEIEDPRRLDGETVIGETLAARVSAGKLLTETLAGLRAKAPAEQTADRLDDLSKRRSVRKARAS